MTSRANLRERTWQMTRIFQTMTRSMWTMSPRRTTINLNAMKWIVRKKPKFLQSHNLEYSQWSLLLSHAGKQTFISIVFVLTAVSRNKSTSSSTAIPPPSPAFYGPLIPPFIRRLECFA